MTTDFIKLKNYIGTPHDYWSFPSNILTYTSDKKGGLLYHPTTAIFASVQRELVLIHAKKNSTLSLEVLDRLKQQYKKIRALGFSRAILNNIPTAKKSREWYVDSSFDPSYKLLNSKSRKHRTQYHSKYDREYKISFYAAHNPAPKELLPALERSVRIWARWRATREMKTKNRHWEERTFTSHYLNWLHNFFKEPNNCWMLTVRNKSGELLGFSGGEIVGTRACIMMIKHLWKPVNIASYLWLKSITYLMNGGIDYICCGEMSNSFKNKLQFKSYQLYNFRSGV